mgnify:FL=1|tara:strand:- start:1045 stop:1614 length:570 start_codon:yes stop_codon:yes gene_type:complete
MASELHVDAIKHSGGTSALTIDSAGVVDLSVNNNVTIYGLNANQTISSSTPSTITNWTQLNNQTSFGIKQVGTAMGVSSGVFSTSRLGVYRIITQLNCYIQSSAVRYIQQDLRFTPNGGSMIAGDYYHSLGYHQSDYTYGTFTRLHYYNFNHANDNVVMQVGCSGTVYLKGSSGYDTFICFEWVAPPVA